MTTTKNIAPATTSDKSVSNYVPFGGQPVDLGEEATMPVAEFPLLQYATGLSAKRAMKDTDGCDIYDEVTGEQMMDGIRYKGFFTEVGKYPDLDAILEAKDAKTIQIIHGNGEEVTHWDMQTVSVFLVAKGLPAGSDEGQCGMAYVPYDRKQKRKSVVSVQVIVRQLLPEYGKPFVISSKSTQSGDLLQAMSKQYKVLRKAHELLKRVGRDIALPLWAYSITLGASKKTDSRGNGVKSSSIYPVVSGVPEEITGEYLHRNEIPVEYVDILRDAVERGAGWAMAQYQFLANNGEQESWAQGSPATPTEDAPF